MRIGDNGTLQMMQDCSRCGGSGQRGVFGPKGCGLVNSQCKQCNGRGGFAQAASTTAKAAAHANQVYGKNVGRPLDLPAGTICGTWCAYDSNVEYTISQEGSSFLFQQGDLKGVAAQQSGGWYLVDLGQTVGCIRFRPVPNGMETQSMAAGQETFNEVIVARQYAAGSAFGSTMVSENECEMRAKRLQRFER